jgi:hypothetical protein
METASGKETLIVLRRLIAYSEKIFQLSKDIVTRVSDRREKPRISTAAVVKGAEGDRIQFYHRQVTLLLLPGALPGRETVRLLLDHEPQRPGEDEVETALRLLARVIPVYPRAFDLVLADALYAKAPFFNFLLARGKHALVVLKEERRSLYQDVVGLFNHVAPQPGSYRSRQCQWWDFPDLLSWPQVQAPVRVVRSQETYTVRRQYGRNGIQRYS